jgi:alkylation response protein AidB-like acyl-CoA dehydrogenase
MDFEFTNTELQVRNKVAELFDEAALAEIETMETADPAGLKELTLRYLAKLAAAEYLSLGLGPDGLKDEVALVAAQEPVSDAAGSIFLAVETSTRMAGGLLAGWASDQQKAEYLEPLSKGQRIAAIAVSEPGGNEPREGWLTTARSEGGQYVLNGIKGPATNAPIADFIIVAGDVDGKLAFFILQPLDDGLVIGERVSTLGYNGLAVAGINLNDVKVPESRVIGPLDNHDALKYLTTAQDMILSLAALGLMKRTHQAASDYAHQHHRGNKPIFAHQEVRFKLADTYTLYQTSQWLCYRAAWFLASGDREADVLVNCAKVFCAEAVEKISSLAMSVWAGQGYLSGNPVERGYRESKYIGLAGTTTEVSRMAIADDVLKRHPI